MEQLWFPFMATRARGLQKCLGCPERRLPSVWIIEGFPQVEFCFPECAQHSAQSIGITAEERESSVFEHGKKHVRMLHRGKSLQKGKPLKK